MSDPIIKDITTKAMLVSLNIKQWNINRQDKQATQELSIKFNSLPGWARGNKSIADKADLSAVTSIIGKLRAFHRTQTLPWNDMDEQRVLPSKNYMYYTTEVRKLTDELDAEVRKLDLDAIKTKAQLGLGPQGLYKDTDYPADGYALRDKYAVRVNVTPIPLSNDFRITTIDSADIDKIKADIESQYIESQKGIMKDLFSRLYEVVETANAAFKDPEVGFQSSKIDNIGKVIEVLRRLNMDEDPKLERLCKLAESKICILDASELKKDINARKQAASDSSKLLEMMAGYN
jgi:hypothetical protein